MNSNSQIENIMNYALKRCKRAIKENEESVFSADCDIIEYMLDNCEIYIKPEDNFFVGVNIRGVHEKIEEIRLSPYNNILRENGLEAGKLTYAYTGLYDFGHTSPDWESVIDLGLFGLKERVVDYLKKATDESARSYYQSTERVYAAVLRFLERCSLFAKEQGLFCMSEGLYALTKRPPKNLYEAMQTSIIYYTLQMYFDRSIPRTMGRVDSLFYPFYIREDKETSNELIKDYLRALDAFKAVSNLPFALGGSDKNGKTLINELSFDFLNIYKSQKAQNVKLHILCSDDTPVSFLRSAMESVRNGNNSIVFLSDKKVIESLVKIGEDAHDARNYHVVGCYECGGHGEVACSCNARVNIQKALEYTLSNGKDILSGDAILDSHAESIESFDDLFRAFSRRLIELCNKAMLATDIWEEKNAKLHSAPIFSSTYISALERGGDLYCQNTAKYNNSSLNAIGLATAVDSLYSIKKLVFDEKRYTIEEFFEILKSNWENNEKLRLYCKNRLEKFGNGHSEVDEISKRTVNVLSCAVSGRPNKKGGCYRLGLFSIDWRWRFGKRTAASADGRKSGETLSQNTSASFGCDKEGATAHLLSVASLDTSSTPNGTVVDIDLHRSSVVGENGLNALVSTLRSYFDQGGFAVHYNILDTEILKDAKKYPDKYPNLQVRLCGWNVLFSSLSDEEKEEFIRRSSKEQV